MPIAYPAILETRSVGVQASWTDLEPMLYALGLGMAEDPLDDRELAFVDEGRLKVVPTFATIIASAAGPRPAGLNRALVLDGGRSLVLHQPLRPSGEVVMDGRIVDVVDKGEGRGAIITREVLIREADTLDEVATLTTSIFARGDGGFGGPSPVSAAPAARPSREPNLSIDIATRPNQALLYRLSGDRNPLHSDPAFAARAGFDRPILHGLCTYGICCRAILQTFADYDPAAITRFGARFSAPCFPGESITVDLWKDGNTLAFEARVKARNAIVIRNGRASLG
ncbi:MAG: MaoC-like dehydratase [Bradyrhizobium sp.]|nr:MaoC-like dehydratase [Bradyrhizobium sp.]